MLLEKQGLDRAARPRRRSIWCWSGSGPETQGFKLAEQLREAWPALRLQVNLGGGSFKAQFKRADKSGAQFALVLGDDEVARGVVALKDLRREMAQEECPMDAISERLGSLLGL